MLLGLSTLLFIGPVFFYLLKSSLEVGFKAGFAIALGIIIGDVIYVILALQGLGGFLQKGENAKWMAMAGGLLLIGMGLKYLLKPSIKTKVSKKTSSRSLWIYLLNGFLINFVNPFVFGVWILFLTINQTKFDSQASVVVSLSVTLAIIFLTDLLKAIFANKLKKFMSVTRLKVVYQIFGIIMLLFGGRLIFMFL